MKITSDLIAEELKKHFPHVYGVNIVPNQIEGDYSRLLPDISNDASKIDAIVCGIIQAYYEVAKSFYMSGSLFRRLRNKPQVFPSKPADIVNTSLWLRGVANWVCNSNTGLDLSARKWITGHYIISPTSPSLVEHGIPNQLLDRSIIYCEWLDDGEIYLIKPYIGIEMDVWYDPFQDNISYNVFQHASEPDQNVVVYRLKGY